jgi:transposase
MTQYKRVAIDTSKAVFTLHGIDQTERPILRTNLSRVQMIAFFKRLPPTEIAMEACGGSHYWARELAAFGHRVRLIPPQYVKPGACPPAGVSPTGGSNAAKTTPAKAGGGSLASDHRTRPLRAAGDRTTTRLRP